MFILKYKSFQKINLDFLTIETNKMPDNNYEMRIVFAETLLSNNL